MNLYIATITKPGNAGFARIAVLARSTDHAREIIQQQYGKHLNIGIQDEPVSGVAWQIGGTLLAVSER